MLKDVVLHQDVGGRIRFDTIALRRRGLRAVEVAVAHDGLGRDVHPDVHPKRTE